MYWSTNHNELARDIENSEIGWNGHDGVWMKGWVVNSG